MRQRKAERNQEMGGEKKGSKRNKRVVARHYISGNSKGRVSDFNVISVLGY